MYYYFLLQVFLRWQGHFPTFHGYQGEDSREFLDNLEMAHLISGRDQEGVKLRAFPLVLKGEARTWYEALNPNIRATYEGLLMAFTTKYGCAETPERLWQQLLQHKQSHLNDFSNYETKFKILWEKWATSFEDRGVAPDFLKKERFVSGLIPELREKVEARYPHTFDEALEIAKQKYQKLNYKVKQFRDGREKVIMDASQLAEENLVGTSNPPPSGDPQQDIIQKLTQTLETLTLNLVQGPRETQRDEGRAPRRQAQEFKCWNFLETGHGMYHCPYPRRNPGDIYPPRRPLQTVQNEQPRQFLRRQPPPPPPPPPQAMAAIPPVPPNEGERGVHVIKLEPSPSSGLGDITIMPAVKRTRVKDKDEEMRSEESDEPKKKKKDKKEEAESSKKKRTRRPRREIGMDDFPLGKNLEPYNLLEDLQIQKPNITWPQLLQVAPKVRRQWPKVVSTRIPKKKINPIIKALRVSTQEDIEPIVDAYIKGRRISNVYVDGGAQMCVMTEKTMHKLGLEVLDNSKCQAKLANNSSVQCLGIVKGVKVTVCSIDARVDMYVMATKGEGYPIILGRPWLIAVNADQKWGAGTLVIKKNGPIVYDLKQGRQVDMKYEATTDEESSERSTSSEEDSTSSGEESSLEVMGLVFSNKINEAPLLLEDTATKDPKLDEKIKGMLGDDLTKEEEESYINMLKRYDGLFINDYSQIKGVDIIQHHIELKEEAKPVAQKLRRLGAIQQEALLAEVNKLLKAGFIYPVTNSEWVSPVVVTPKKNGKWRVCVDYKPLNAATKRDHFPLPFQDEILNEVAGYERYTVCDGYSGYFQI